MGDYYDRLLGNHLPAGTAVDQATPEMLNEAKKLAGPEVLNVTLIIPVILVGAFTLLFFYMRNKKTTAAI
jgi:hypothetical protein